MITTFENFIIQKEHLSKGNSVIIENYFNSTRKFLSFLPNIDIDLPNVEKKAKIQDISDFSNPIVIRLQDGSKLFFTSDEYRRLHQKPEIGRTMLVKFQRCNHDATPIPSKITFCQII